MTQSPIPEVSEFLPHPDDRDAMPDAEFARSSSMNDGGLRAAAPTRH